MKLKTLCSAALVATILFGSAASAFAENGDEKVLTSEGTITYVEDNTPNPPVDPENPEEPVDPTDPVVPNDDGGPLAVDAVTKLDFKTQKAVTTDQTYFAEQIEVFKTGVSDGTRGNYVQVTDKRLASPTEERTGWTLSAKMTQQFTSGSVVLDGSTLTYTNPYIDGAGADAQKPVLGSAASNFELNESGNSVNVMGTADGTTGFGTWTIEFGSSAGVNGADDTTGKANAADENLIEDGSISLFVPGNTVKTATAFTGKVLWTVAATPIS
ncbi:WxL domain-containing protein [Enterococcus sp. BWM-S5]|uniref:WxL domain-containing protein n=1 Tax=Enterococcus larvae TaxID=2794352 RepID=A0ABS4CHS9_9ENTE|nr:WxL domain-containing protein [Enterococcus larvae]MBP1046185.1 WxL domain-containing protein [Enterococcus larvae]